ncbi:DUF6114 domain-containing protein [Streptomyces lavendulae]|uniref:DUF6114 domain-containing protein n=1 Tax=Streptomyces lavendulae TaxID=1914 RepID=UPI0024A35C74|nr:DUF6114 domain-containing protein [Streptomyces lavendulae]GLX23631.1 hypothetical protein Slala01_72750 [Streptomyces lavendulae subsp. lavendulae]GLX31533.1 hypothetical protein Slala02_73520 [Streptomyces lavendulae subsp. lavendulae]
MLLGPLVPSLPLPGPRARLRAWRRTRPFWGGLLLVLGGAELLLVPLSPLTVLVSLGLGGIAAIGIGAALIVAGLFLWFLPQARAYVSVHALLLSVLSFVATNLGGFLVGMLLGIAGSALGFGWTPVAEEGTGEGADPGKGPGGAARLPAAVLPVVLLAALVSGTPRARAEPAAAGPPTAARTPPTVTTSLFAPRGFALAGVTELTTADGPRRVLVLKMAAASLRDYRLHTRDGREEYALEADSLELRGDVTLYLTRFSGCIEGLLCVTFSPDGLPAPPVIPPFVFMTRVSAEQALVTSDVIATEGLRLGAS